MDSILAYNDNDSIGGGRIKQVKVDNDKDMTHLQILRFFLKLQVNIRLYHWTTLSYSRHIATDKLDAALLPLVDDFIETYMAEFDRPPKHLKKVNLSCRIASDERMKKYLARKRIELVNMDLPSKDLESVRDDITSAMTKTLYLFETI
jgi:hypothetical protein